VHRGFGKHASREIAERVCEFAGARDLLRRPEYQRTAAAGPLELGTQLRARPAAEQHPGGQGLIDERVHGLLRGSYRRSTNYLQLIILSSKTIETVNETMSG
jgi:hypothetical protein